MDNPTASTDSSSRSSKRVRTNNPCQYCKKKKIRCQFPPGGDDGILLPCEHCTQFGIECIVGGITRNMSTVAADPSASTSQTQIIDSSNFVSRADHSQYVSNGRAQGPVHDVIDRDDPLATGVGLLSLAGSQEARYLGGSSGLTWARLVSATLHREGVLPSLHPSSFSDPPLPFAGGPQLLGSPPPLPPVHLRLYYLDVCYKHVQARYACLSWTKIRSWHEQADSICHPHTETGTNLPGSSTNVGAAFFLWLVYGYGARMTEDLQIPGAVSHEVFYNAAIALLPTITTERSLLSVQAQLFLTLYTYRHPNSELSLWRLGGAAFRACQEIGLHRRSPRRSVPDAVEEEERRRTFWTAYVLDRMISMQLGRPFLFHDKDIDIPLPLNVNDDFNVRDVMTRLQIEGESRVGISDDSHKELTTMSAFLHSVHLSRIRTDIHDATYQLASSGNEVESSATIDHLLQVLEIWRSQHPPPKSMGECLVQLGTEHWEMEYHHTVQTLLRPLSTRMTHDHRFTRLCAESSGGLCRNQWIQIQKDPRNLSISALYRLFLSGLSLVYIALTQPDVVFDQPESFKKVQEDSKACLDSLHVFVTQYPWAIAYKECFAQLMMRFEVRMTPSTSHNTSDRDLDQNFTFNSMGNIDTESFGQYPTDFWNLPDPGLQNPGDLYSPFGGDNMDIDALLRSIGLSMDYSGLLNIPELQNGNDQVGNFNLD